MGKPKTTTDTQRPQGMSRYARKIAARKAGAITSDAPMPVVCQSTAAAIPLAPGDLPQEVVVTVRSMHFNLGYVLVALPDGTELRLQSYVLKNGHRGRVSIGNLIRCEIEEDPKYKGRRIARVIAVSR